MNIQEAFRRDGAVHVPAAMSPDLVAEALRCFEWTVANPSPAAQSYYGDSGARFYQDLFNTLSWPVYEHLVSDSRLSDLVLRALGCENLWFFFEQIFLKEGGDTRRTPWHQDTSYFPVDGEDIAIVWMSFDSVAQEDALEFVRGSHRGTLFNGSSFAEDDDTDPLYDEGDMQRLPDIEVHRDDFDIIGWAVEPGDVVLFHPSVLHGGGQVRAGKRRRTLALRYFGDDCNFVSRPSVRAESEVGFNRESSDSRDVSYFYEGLQPGDRFRHPEFLQVAG